jgi:hypothetical protein
MEFCSGSKNAWDMTMQTWQLLKLRMERVLIGSGLSLLAWILERAILRSARQE